MARTYGNGDDGIYSFYLECIKVRKNAFRYPKDPEAVFHQKKDPVFLDVRTSALPLHIMTNQKGVKPKTRKQKELMEAVNNEINAKKEVNMEEEMKGREDEVIDLNRIVNIDNEIEKLDFDTMDLEEGKPRKKKKNAKVEMEMNTNNDFIKKERQKKKAQKKSKSRYIVKF
jgi:hypothetical protein